MAIRGQRSSVLIVEGDEIAGRYLLDLVEAQGHQVECVRDGASAVLLLDSGYFVDTVILAWSPSGEDSLFTAKLMRSVLPAAKLVLVGGGLPRQTVVEAQGIGARVLRTPFLPQELVALL